MSENFLYAFLEWEHGYEERMLWDRLPHREYCGEDERLKMMKYLKLNFPRSPGPISQ
jgi:hypothetical protein